LSSATRCAAPIDSSGFFVSILIELKLPRLEGDVNPESKIASMRGAKDVGRRQLAARGTPWQRDLFRANRFALPSSLAQIRSE